MSEKPLAGKAAFVSGSGRNIGRAVAVGLAQLGANVVVNGATSQAHCEEVAQLVRAHGVQAAVSMGDMGDAHALAGIIEEARAAFGGIDIVVNNAAIRPHKPFVENSDEDWYSVIDTALTAGFRTSRAFLPHMVEKGWGRIVNITGMKAIHGYFEGAPISAAKHGVWGMTKALAQEFGPKGVTINAISPGQVLTEGRDGTDPKKLASIPVGFMAEPEDIASAIIYLVRPESRFINGQMINVNGGQTT